MPGVIVVGFDGSDNSRRALEWAKDDVGKDGRVVAVYAYHPPPEWEGGNYWAHNVAHHQEHGRALLAEIETSGPPVVETDLLEGHPGIALIRAADAHGADKIVVGSHGHGHRRFGAGLGSITTKVLHNTDRPVIVVPAEGG